MNYISGPCTCFTNWTPWTQCSGGCGQSGTQTRSRSCNNHSGCQPQQTTETQSCSGNCGKFKSII